MKSVIQKDPDGKEYVMGLTCVYAILLLLSPHCRTSHPEQHATLWIQVYLTKERERVKERERENL